MCEIDVTIIGGGIVGCAVAASTAARGLSTVLLESAEDLAMGTTSRNSEVAHGGMYYPTDTFKARFCVQGRRMLRSFCKQAGVEYRECGKLIVAVTSEEIPALENLQTLGQNNGVDDLQLVADRQLADLLPEVCAVVGLFSPQTAIFNAEATARAYARLAAERGAQILTGARVTDLNKTADSWLVSINGTGNQLRQGWSHSSKFVVNATGLYSDVTAQMAGMDIDKSGYRLTWVKGNYFSVDPAHAGRIDKLVYPVPPADKSSLGVHVCLDLAGQLRLGPDVEQCDSEEYSVDVARGADFFHDAKRFLPWLKATDLAPSMSGIRPRFSVQGFSDFVIKAESGDFAGLINLIGIDSPGLTSSPAIAEEVVRLISIH